MALIDEISVARKVIITEGYDMSIGELINLYKDNELQINPAYQRLFRWDATRKARLIESILLGLPLPPIFVYQRDDGVWELIDGLQRMSTIFEFVGVLSNGEGLVAPSRLEGTTFLPGLANAGWENSDPEANDGIGTALQIQLKRARLRVEILKEESDPLIKYELFQRLNTGGVSLSQQEVRNSVGFMVNAEFQKWLLACSDVENFKACVDQTPVAMERQSHVELVLRFFAYRSVPYTSGLDVHEYLDDALLKLARDADYDMAAERSILERTFNALAAALGSGAFKRWNGDSFSGMFLLSAFEVVALGVSHAIDEIDALHPLEERNKFIADKCKVLWANPVFQKHSGAGVRGTTRLMNLLPLAEEYFKP